MIRILENYHEIKKNMKNILILDEHASRNIKKYL